MQSMAPVRAPSSSGSSSASGLFSGATGSSELGKDAFMKLLIQQLKNQDPMKPMEDKEFLAELAQFSALEQAEETNASLTSLMQVTATGQAVTLVGKNVEYLDADGNRHTGQVSAITFEKGIAWLTVGEEQINPSNVTKVW